jgi:hypothetical protein
MGEPGAGDQAATAPQVRCRVFAGSQGLGILALWGVAMAVMWATIALGLPPAVAPVVLLAALYLGVQRLAGTATYTLEAAGVRRQWIALAGGRVHEDYRRFEDLRRWKHDETMSRGFQRYEYLELDGLRGPRWVITGRQDAAGFAAFKDAFVARAATLERPGGLARRRGFYASWYGKLTALALAGATAALVVAAGAGLVPLTGLIKLALLMIPGSAYLLWRSFGAPR